MAAIDVEVSDNPTAMIMQCAQLPQLHGCKMIIMLQEGLGFVRHSMRMSFASLQLHEGNAVDRTSLRGLALLLLKEVNIQHGMNSIPRFQI